MLFRVIGHGQLPGGVAGLVSGSPGKAHLLIEIFYHGILGCGIIISHHLGNAARSGIPASDVPSEPMKLAMTVVATGPIILLYPFLQKYFVKGVTIGAVKG